MLSRAAVRRFVRGPFPFLATMVFSCLFAAPTSEARLQQGWSIEPRPAVTLGADQADTLGFFAVVLGATRLPEGRILVADRGDYALKLFGVDGKYQRRLVRKGSGPGEVGYLKSFLRCGDSLVTIDIDGNRVSVFSLDGTYARSFRFGSPQTGRPPYASECNRGGTFVHYGWESRADMKGGVYRPMVPFWLSASDSGVRTVIATLAGSERYGVVLDNQFRGSRPLPLGKEPVIAAAADRVYIGTADTYEIAVYDLSGRSLGVIRRTGLDLALTRADIDAAKAREISRRGESSRVSVEREYASMPFPKAVPAYTALIVDADGYLWVQDFPRGGTDRVHWTVFDRSGAPRADLSLPTDLQVYEIGHDYVLGRYLDPALSVPEVRLYRLSR